MREKGRKRKVLEEKPRPGEWRRRHLPPPLSLETWKFGRGRNNKQEAVFVILRPLPYSFPFWRRRRRWLKGRFWQAMRKFAQSGIRNSPWGEKGGGRGGAVSSRLGFRFLPLKYVESFCRETAGGGVDRIFFFLHPSSFFACGNP